MRISIPQLLNLGLSGYAFVGDDIGGFAGSPTPELLTRWMELGVFNPIYRNHGTKGSRDREPWVDGPEHEAIRRHYIETRYQLLPYIYTSMEETSRTGIPLMRPMFLEYPNLETLQTNETEFMFGPDLLVGAKVDEKFEPYNVTLPPGIWYDFWTGRDASATKTLNPPLDVLPVFVRGGAILPEQPVVQNTDQVPQGPLQISVYPGPDCHGSLYQDDGNTLKYAHGEFLRMEFKCDSRADLLDFKFSTTQANYKPWWNSMKVVLLGFERAPREISVDGKKITDFQFDSERRAVAIELLAGSQGEIVVTK
jgi:alpha-glucosidase